jgi:hypothetical protein
MVKGGRQEEGLKLIDEGLAAFKKAGSLSAAVVLGNGLIVPGGFAVSSPEGGVRPALWLGR